jgi:hypothetical protein
MRVYFHNFWNGYIEDKSINTFITLLSDVFNQPIEIGNHPDTSDILMESIFGSSFLVKTKSWMHTFLFSGESRYYDGDLTAYSCILGFTPTHSNFVEYPLFIMHMLQHNESTYEPCTTALEHSAACIISNGAGEIRNRFLCELEKKIKVNYGGSYKNNIGYTIQGDHHSDAVLSFFRKHRFVITMENSKEKCYITEKILNGFRAGVIPVYWGSPNISKYFNPKRFLHVENESYEEMQRIITRMLQMTEDEYQQMIHEAVFIKPIDIVYSNIVSEIQSIVM